MIIQVPKVSVDGSHYVGEEPADILELQAHTQVRVTGPIRYDLHAETLSGELLVKGEVAVDVELECGRCAEFYSTTVRVLSFLRAYEIKENVESVDLTPDLREDVLLEMPAYPVCSTACQGLCPQCGANLNQGPCACRPVQIGGAWSGLDGLKLGPPSDGK
jgi:uncharacterized protein